MLVYKRAERIIKASCFIKGFKATDPNVKVTEVAEYCKWMNLRNGGKVQDSLRIKKVNIPSAGAYVDCYFAVDALGMLVTSLEKSPEEIVAWLNENGYKTVHDWYIEDYGMTEETWQEWNS